MSGFDSILKSVAAEDRAVLEKYPELTSYVNDLEVGTTRYVNWYQNAWDAEHGMTKGEWEARQHAAELEAQLGSGEQHTPPPGLSADDVNRIVADRTKKITDDVALAINAMDRFYGQMTPLTLKHKDEFNEILDPKTILEYMTKNGLGDPQTAYDRMVAQRRWEVIDSRHKADIEAAEQRGVERTRQELAMGPSGVLPTDNSGGIMGVTAAPAPGQLPKEILEKTDGMKLDNPALAQAGLEAYRKGLLPTT